MKLVLQIGHLVPLFDECLDFFNIACLAVVKS
jgi:hypothetical protein